MKLTMKMKTLILKFRYLEYDEISRDFQTE